VRPLRNALASAVVVTVLVLLPSACHNEGGIKLNQPVAGDNTPDTPDDGGNGGGNGGGGGGGNGGGGNGGGGGNADTRFVGTWIASYGDDLPVGTGRRQYAMRLAITRDGDTLTGNGSMVRFYNSGQTAFDAQPRTISATGTASGAQATLTLSGTSGYFANNPVWYLRNVDSRIVGMYAERDASLVVQRSGHTLWHPAGAVDLNASWAAAYDDKFGAGAAFAARDRTAAATLAVANNAVSGVGSYVEQRATGVPEEFSFDVGQGTLDGTQVRFGFLNFTPASGEVDWFGYHSGSVIVAAYGQFNGSSEIVRFGNATWYKTGDTQPSQFDRDWTTSFGDSAAAGNLFADYVMAMTGVAVNGNSLTGTVRVLNETAAQPAFVDYTIENGTIVGNKLTMDIARNGERFAWAMRLAGNVLVGSYTQYDASDAFVSRGNAEWRFGSATGLAGTYAAAYVDTSTTNATENRASQLAVIAIDPPDENGVFAGTGSVRLGGETNRRQFALNGTAPASGHVRMTWENGVDLSGNTVWNFRKAGAYLFGTYTNYASDNQTIEFQGHAAFVRAPAN